MSIPPALAANPAWFAAIPIACGPSARADAGSNATRAAHAHKDAKAFMSFSFCPQPIEREAYPARNWRSRKEPAEKPTVVTMSGLDPDDRSVVDPHPEDRDIVLRHVLVDG